MVLALALLVLPASLHAMGQKQATPAVNPPAAVATPAATAERAKYVFLFIGDGMSMAQINAAEIYANAMAASNIGIQQLGFTRFPVSGLTTTFDSGSFITDSASAGTAIATGFKTINGVINMDPTKTRGYATIAEMAKWAGYRVGIISNVSIDHATPAAFYARVPSRGDMYEIGLQLAQSNFDFFGGGGFAQPTGRNRDRPDVLGIARAAGYTYVNEVAAFRALRPGVGKVLTVNPTLQDSFSMPYEIDRRSDDLALADYVAKAIELLDGEQGFFIMAESGKIDWACHANDAAAAIHDTLAFDRAIAEALKFYRQHPAETLIIVTGDHETGGMSLGFAGTRYDTFFSKVGRQRGSYIAFNSTVLQPYKASVPAARARLADLLPQIEAFFGFQFSELAAHEQQLLDQAFQRSMGNEVVGASQEAQYLLYGGYEPLTVKLVHIMNQRAGIGWTTYSHTGVPVATFAIGSGSTQFGGYYDNTDIFRKLVRIMGLGDDTGTP
jgi:alkaline phosphatase